MSWVKAVDAVADKLRAADFATVAAVARDIRTYAGPGADAESRGIVSCAARRVLRETFEKLTADWSAAERIAFVFSAGDDVRRDPVTESLFDAVDGPLDAAYWQTATEPALTSWEAKHGPAAERGDVPGFLAHLALWYASAAAAAGDVTPAERDALEDAAAAGARRVTVPCAAAGCSSRFYPVSDRAERAPYCADCADRVHGIRRTAGGVVTGAEL